MNKGNIIPSGITLLGLAILAILFGLTISCASQTPPTSLLTFTPPATTASTVTPILPAASATPQSTPTPTPWPLAVPLQVTATLTAQLGQGQVMSLAWMPDSSALIVGTTNGVRLLEAGTWREIGYFETGTAVWNEPHTMEVSPDGRVLALTFHSSWDIGMGDTLDSLTLWSLPDGKPLPAPSVGTPGDYPGYESVGWRGKNFSQDGQRLLTIDDYQVRVWDVATTTLLQTFPPAGNAILSPDGERVYTADSQIQVWDVESGEMLTSFPIGEEGGKLAINPTGDMLVIVGTQVRLFDPNTGEPIIVLENSQESWGQIVFSLDGLSVAVGNKIWEIASGKLMHMLEQTAYICALSPDLRFFAQSKTYASVEVSDVADGESLGQVYGSVAFSPALSPDGKQIMAVMPDGVFKLWDFTAQQFLDTTYLPAEGSTEGYYWFTFSPNGQWIAAKSGKEIWLWTTATGGAPRVLSGPTSYAAHLVFSPDSQMLFASAEMSGSIWQWELTSEQLVRTLDAFPSTITGLDISPDSRLVAASSDLSEFSGSAAELAKQATIKLWDVQDGTLQRAFNTVSYASGLQFSKDGAWMVVGGMEKTFVIDALSGHVLQTLLPLRYWSTPGVALHPAGRLLAMNADGIIHIWDTASQQTVLTIPGRPTWQVFFHPDGNSLMARSLDGVLRIWKIEILP